jgi:hypothetical protein
VQLLTNITSPTLQAGTNITGCLFLQTFHLTVFFRGCSRQAQAPTAKTPLLTRTRYQRPLTIEADLSRTACRSASVLASAAGLSGRRRAILGNRKAIPDL